MSESWYVTLKPLYTSPRFKAVKGKVGPRTAIEVLLSDREGPRVLPRGFTHVVPLHSQVPAGRRKPWLEAHCGHPEVPDLREDMHFGEKLQVEGPEGSGCDFHQEGFADIYFDHPGHSQVEQVGDVPSPPLRADVSMPWSPYARSRSWAATVTKTSLPGRI